MPKPIRLECLGLLLEREQIPQAVEIRHFHMESVERFEPAQIFRNQQVAGSIPIPEFIGECAKNLTLHFHSIKEVSCASEFHESSKRIKRWLLRNVDAPTPTRRDGVSFYLAALSSLCQEVLRRPSILPVFLGVLRQAPRTIEDLERRTLSA